MDMIQTESICRPCVSVEACIFFHDSYGLCSPFPILTLRIQSRLTVLLNSGEGNQFKQCAEPLTAYTFPNKKKDAMGYHLLNLARSDYSVPDLVQRRKQLKQKGEPVACLVNTTQLNTLFYLLDPDLLVVDIQSSDPDVYLTDKLTRSSASIIRLSRNNFGRLLKSIPPGPYSNWTTFIYRKSITSYTPGLQILATLVVQLFGLLALITGCALVVPRQERMNHRL
ncbi:hypothetical protein FGIG_01232 [Fasciola gigantica]|uniref:Uncharacterized protein n=1 Tax=Fasciola gigantica TaxID=46835 RepID=A0A504Z176_FASGI|nr:hypothetical protein FGIG_01232 [Fasciola gigantica]